MISSTKKNQRKLDIIKKLLSDNYHKLTTGGKNCKIDCRHKDMEV